MLCLLGPLTMGLWSWNLFSLAWTDRLIYLYAPAGLVRKPQDIESTWIRERALTEDQFVGTMQAALFDRNTSCRSNVAVMLDDGSLPERYQRPLLQLVTESLNDSEANWLGTEGIVPALLRHGTGSEPDRQSLIDSMIRRRAPFSTAGAGRQVGERASWTNPLMELAITRKLTTSQYETFVSSIATPRVTVGSIIGPIRPGEVFSVNVATLPTIGEDAAVWRWQAMLTVDPGICELISDGPQIAWGARNHTLWFRAPSAAPPSGKATLRVGSIAEFSRDRIVNTWRAREMSSELVVHETDNIDATRSVELSATIVPSSVNRPAQEHVTTIPPHSQWLTGLSSGLMRRNGGLSDLVFKANVHAAPASMAFVVTMFDGPRIHAMGRVVAIEGQDADWALTVPGFLESPENTSILLTPLPEILADTPAATKVYTGPSLVVELDRLDPRGDM